MIHFRSKYILLVLTSLCLSTGWAQKPGSVWPVGIAGKEYNVLDARGRKQGPWIRIYGNSKMLYYRGQFKDNIPQGEFVFYYETGDISSLINHVQDTTINDFKGFHPDGKTLMSQGRYVGSESDGVWKRRKQGVWKFYDSSGVLRTEESYEHDLLSGLSKTFYGSGKALGEFNYLHGHKQGAFIEWFENGQKKSEGTYQNDIVDGPIVMYNEKGQRESEGTYKNGLKEGRWMTFLPSGSVEMQVKYAAGKEVLRRLENGTFSEFYPSGIPKSEYSYEQGKKDGPFTEWYDLGHFENVATSPEEQQLGIAMRQKLVDVKIKVQGNYLNDSLEGEIQFFDESGMPIKTEMWGDGALLKTE